MTPEKHGDLFQEWEDTIAYCITVPQAQLQIPHGQLSPNTVAARLRDALNGFRTHPEWTSPQFTRSDFEAWRATHSVVIRNGNVYVVSRQWISAESPGGPKPLPTAETDLGAVTGANLRLLALLAHRRLLTSIITFTLSEEHTNTLLNEVRDGYDIVLTQSGERFSLE